MISRERLRFYQRCLMECERRDSEFMNVGVEAADLRHLLAAAEDAEQMRKSLTKILELGASGRTTAIKYKELAMHMKRIVKRIAAEPLTDPAAGGGE